MARRPLPVHPVVPQFLRFAIVGVAGFAADAGLTLALQGLGVVPAWARLPAIAIAMLLTWWLNRGYAFRVHVPLVSLLPYTGVAAGAAAVNYGLFLWLVAAGWGSLPAIVGATSVSLVFSFTGYRWFVFRGGAKGS